MTNADSVYLARQPLLTEKNDVFGFELYRASWHAQSCVDQGDVAAARVLTDALLSIGLEGISSRQPVLPEPDPNAAAPGPHHAPAAQGSRP